jgi:hypothetical protein
MWSPTAMLMSPSGLNVTPSGGLVSDPTLTTTSAARFGAHAKKGTVMSSVVVVACVTVASKPSTVTVFWDGVG